MDPQRALDGLIVTGAVVALEAAPQAHAEAREDLVAQDRMRIELARVRARGWAISEQQLELNHRGIAVPLRDRHGDVAGALSVTMPMGHESSEDAVARVLSVLSETAQAMRNLI